MQYTIYIIQCILYNAYYALYNVEYVHLTVYIIVIHIIHHAVYNILYTMYTIQYTQSVRQIRVNEGVKSPAFPLHTLDSIQYTLRDEAYKAFYVIFMV